VEKCWGEELALERSLVLKQFFIPVEEMGGRWSSRFLGPTEGKIRRGKGGKADKNG